MNQGMASKTSWVAEQDSWSEDGIAYAYTLSCLPPPLSNLLRLLTSTPHVHMAQSRDVVEVFVALFQVIYLDTLYGAQEDQLELFGSFAFSLTVALYAVVSLINLVGSLLVPMYPTVFLVHSEVMDKVERQCGGNFLDGAGR